MNLLTGFSYYVCVVFCYLKFTYYFINENRMEKNEECN